MRRTPWFRPLGMMLAIWLPLILGEPGVVHACAAHGPVAGTGEASAPGAARASHHSSGHHVAASGGAQRQGNVPGHDHQSCTCVSCCVGSADAAPSPAAPITDFVAAVNATAAPSSVGSLPRPAPEYSQPYTTGPPRA